MNAPATLMVCYSYAFKVSPTLKNICSYLYDTEGTTVDVMVEDTYHDETLHLTGINVIDTGAEPGFRRFLRPLLRRDKKVHFQHALKKQIGRYSRVFAVDFEALQMVSAAGYDLSKVVYLSLEGVDFMLQYDKAHAAKLLAGCGFRVVQSKERAEDLNAYLSSSLQFEYLPVSCRFEPPKPKPMHASLQLVYSGYFAEWACLTETLAAYRASRCHEVASLLLQGHALGTDGYLSQVKMVADEIPGVSIDTSYYGDAAHAELLNNNHAGAAFYKNVTGTSNFDNMILSSGKIAAYLWSGLAVLTNIRSEYSDTPPFVFVDLADPGSLRSALERVNAQRELYRDAAYEMANRVYNFDLYMSRICEKMR